MYEKSRKRTKLWIEFKIKRFDCVNTLNSQTKRKNILRLKYANDNHNENDNDNLVEDGKKQIKLSNVYVCTEKRTWNFTMKIR